MPLPKCLACLVDAVKELVVVDGPKRFESGGGIRRVNRRRLVKVIYYPRDKRQPSDAIQSGTKHSPTGIFEVDGCDVIASVALSALT